MKKALVTGANGFLGAWMTRRLLDEGYDVTALVRQNSDLTELGSCKPRYAYGDVTDLSSLQAAFREQDVIFHLAGVISYKPADDPLMFRVNVGGTQNVVNICEQQQIALVHVSSVVAVGASTTPVSLTEDSIYNVAHLKMGYFDSKKQAEDLVINSARTGKIRAVCVNPSTIYGFGDARKGSRKNQIKVASGKMPFYTSGGVNVVAAEDVVNGILLAHQKGRNGERYLLTNENMTIQSLFERIARAAQAKPPKLYMPNWLLHSIGFTGDQLQKVGVNIGISSVNAITATMFHWFDSHKARHELGFNPGPADHAIEKSVQWMHDHNYLK